MIKKRIHRILNCVNMDLVDLSSMVTQIIMEYGNKCTWLSIDANTNEIKFETVEVIKNR